MKTLLASIGRKVSVKKHIVVLIVALLATLLVCNFTDDLSRSLVESTFKHLVDKPNTEYIYDDSGIPIVDYGYKGDIYIGKQRNPVAISQASFRYYEDYMKGEESSRELFFNCVDWLVNNSVHYDNYAILEYNFPWPYANMTSPWRSGMAQGQAIQALIKAHSLTGINKYSDTAERLLNTFFVEVENGGVTYKSHDDGWWYEEYADEGGIESRVLNGMIFAVLGIYEYYQYTEDSDAKYLFDQGIIALKESISDYDMNGYSYYDILGNPAGESYHQIHIQQLNDLHYITNEDIFKEYADRWESYEEPLFIANLISNPTKTDVAIFAVNFFF